MSSHDYVIANDTGANVRADLNLALLAIQSQNSGGSEPSTTYAYQFWADTGNDLLKQRNAANNAWISILTLSTGAVTATAALATAANSLTLGSDAQGDIAYRGAADYDRLAKGTASQVLQMNSGATAPEWTSSVTGLTYGKYTLDGTPDTDHTANGPQTNTFASGYSSTIMDLVYLGSSSKWLEADADATGTSINLLGIALEAKTDTQAMNVALPGSFVRDDTWAFTPGVPLYVHTELGAITATKPTGSGDVVRTVGFAVHADMIYFNPSSDYVTLA